MKKIFLNNTDEQRLIDAARQAATDSIYVVTPEMFKGEEDEDDTAAIQAALNKGGIIQFQPRRYVINPKNGTNGLRCVSNSNIILPAGCEIEAKYERSEQNAIFRLQEIENVVFSGGGKIIGNMDRKGQDINNIPKDPTDTTHLNKYWTHGFSMLDAKNIIIENLEIENIYGDGFDIKSSDPEKQKVSANIKIQNVRIHNILRNGIAVASCQGFKSVNNEIYDVYGTMPQAGIDIEASVSVPGSSNCVIENTYIYECKSLGLNFSGNNDKIWISNCNLLSSLRISQGANQVRVSDSAISKFHVKYISKPDQELIVTGCRITEIQLYQDNYNTVKFNHCDIGVFDTNSDITPQVALARESTDENTLKRLVFDSCRFVTTSTSMDIKKSLFVYGSMDPSFMLPVGATEEFILNNCSFYIHHPGGLTLTCLGKKLIFSNNHIYNNCKEQISSDSNARRLLNLTTFNNDGTIVMTNNFIDLKEVNNYRFLDKSIMQLSSPALYVSNNIIEISDKQDYTNTNLIDVEEAYSEMPFVSKQAIINNNIIKSANYASLQIKHPENFSLTEQNNIFSVYLSK